VVLVVVAIGGALGAVSRYLVSGWVQDLTAGFFPWGTLAVNVLGSLLLGFALVWLEGAISSGQLRDFVAIGLLGSFTTFSTFTYEAVTLLRDGEWWRAGGYTAGSLLLGLFAVVVGAALAASVARLGVS
jgi:CrcB protein